MTYKVANIVRIVEAEKGFGERPDDSEVLNRIILQTSDDNQQMELEVEEKWLQQMGLDEGMQVNLLIHTDGTAMIQK